MAAGGDNGRMTHKLAAPLLGIATTAALFIGAPVAQADVCGDVGGRHVASAGARRGLAGDAVDAAVIGAAVDRPSDMVTRPRRRSRAGPAAPRLPGVPVVPR